MADHLNKAERLALERGESRNDQFFDEPDRTVEIARQALAISPLVADAYVNLATHSAGGPAERLFYWHAAAISARLALGEAAFDELKGDFWGFHETRPFMRAKHGLAIELWSGGQFGDAIGHAEEMLRLNPNDNQGVRYLLLDWYIRMEKDKKAWTLLGRYKDEASTYILWAHALLAFRRDGEAEGSETALREATASNRHISAYLLGKKRLPSVDPDYYKSGEPSEAVSYVLDARESWRNTPGALDWLERSVAR